MRPGASGSRPVTYTVNPLSDSALRQSVGGAGLIVPYPRHGPSGTMGSPQYKDGTSMATT